MALKIPYPLGATPGPDGTGFALYSSVAERVELCLFDSHGREMRRVPLERDGDTWFSFLNGTGEGQLYAYRVDGPYAPEKGCFSNPAKLLLDPYARQLAGEFTWHPALQASHAEDSAAYVPKCVVRQAVSTTFTRPAIPWSESVYYETNLRGYTMCHEAVAESDRGRFAGMRNAQVLDYIRSLGVTAIELLPVHAWIDERHLVERGLRNYWGYNSVAFFAPMPRLGGSDPVAEFRDMVNAIHDAGLEVVLDVVYNHTGESGEDGPCLGFRGIDNNAYYRMAAGKPPTYVNDTGCGNTIDADSPVVQQLVLDSLTYWHHEMGVDGFRFDLASILGRHASGFDAGHPLLSAIASHPALTDAKLVAEPWDPGPGGYQLGSFRPPWNELNDKFRDATRQFWRGDENVSGDLARRIHGSAELFEASGRTPHASVNKVTSHDGYTLQDVVSYETRHNLANGENNRDGHRHNFSRNYGVEGPTEDGEVLALRRKQRLNMLATMFCSQGTPFLLAGDEFGNSQCGNNNAYAQDNETGWLDWTGATDDPAFVDAVRRLASIRRDYPQLRLDQYVHGRATVDGRVLALRWINPDGGLRSDEDWDFGNAFGLLLEEQEPGGEVSAVAVLLNSWQQPLTFALEPLLAGARWEVLFCSEPGDCVSAAQSIEVSEHSIVIAATRRPAPAGNQLSADYSVLPASPTAGMYLPITSLPGDFGIGEIGGAARRFVDDLHDMQLGVWQILPLGPTAYGDSPYQALSTFAGNEMLIDIQELIDTGLLTADEAGPLTALSRNYADYGALIPIKSGLLAMAAQRFTESASQETSAAFRHFVAENDDAWLHEYALFRVLKSVHEGRAWTEWPRAFANRDAAALDALQQQMPAEINAVKVLQFLFHSQWTALRNHARERGILLFGDMPIYIAFDSADAWAGRELLQVDETGKPEFVAGVPPDYFSEDGQLWGNPLYDWAYHEETQFEWWVRRLKAATALVDIVRIDHFRGFESFWAVPAGAKSARTGEWKPGPGDAVFEALRAAFGNLPIVAENLGVITEEVEDLRKRFSMPGMHVLQFAVDDPTFDLAGVRANSVCYTGTHDNDTTLGWFNGSPGDLRTEAEIRKTQASALAMCGGKAETVHLDMIRAAFSTAANVAIAPLQDYLGLGSEARINTPGKAGGNWRWRFEAAALTPEAVTRVANLVRESGRGFDSGRLSL